MSFKVQFTALRANSRYLRMLSDPSVLSAPLEDYAFKWGEKIALITSKYPDPVTPPTPKASGGVGVRGRALAARKPHKPYKRTYHLLKSWRVRLTGTTPAIQVTVLNAVQDPKGIYYARRVHGLAEGTAQWDLHREHGWIALHDTIEAMGGSVGFAKGAQTIIDNTIRTQGGL